MSKVGSYEAKAHLPRMLEKVAQGEKITITKHGVPVAELVPVSEYRAQPEQEVIEQLRRFRQGRTLGSASIKEMIEVGRR